MPVTYETWLVLLSIVMAIQGAYVGLSLPYRLPDVRACAGGCLLAGATFARGRDLDHAFRRHAGGAAAVPGRLFGAADAAVVSGLRDRGRGAVYATSSGPLTLLRLTLSACLMGGGIFTMHYIGMSALDATPTWCTTASLSPPAWRSPSPPPAWRCGWRPGGEGGRR